MTANSGRLVETKSGKIGKTLNRKGVINGKVPVYLATEFIEKAGFNIPVSFAEQAILCNPDTLTIKGFID